MDALIYKFYFIFTPINASLTNKISSVGLGNLSTQGLPYTATDDCFFVLDFVTPSTGAFYLYLDVNNTTVFPISGQAGGANYQSHINGFLKKGDKLSQHSNGAGNVSSLVLKIQPLIVT